MLSKYVVLTLSKKSSPLPNRLQSRALPLINFVKLISELWILKAINHKTSQLGTVKIWLHNLLLLINRRHFPQRLSFPKSKVHKFISEYRHKKFCAHIYFVTFRKLRNLKKSWYHPPEVIFINWTRGVDNSKSANKRCTPSRLQTTHFQAFRF